MRRSTKVAFGFIVETDFANRQDYGDRFHCARAGPIHCEVKRDALSR
jgi:hypothetical protein